MDKRERSGLQVLKVEATVQPYVMNRNGDIMPQLNFEANLRGTHFDWLDKTYTLDEKKIGDSWLVCPG